MIAVLGMKASSVAGWFGANGFLGGGGRGGGGRETPSSRVSARLLSG